MQCSYFLKQNSPPADTKSNFPVSTSGYAIYSAEKEYKRLQMDDKWVLSNINKDYKAIPTYPSQFIIPTGISEEDLKPVLKFRSKGKIPVLNWIHPETKASLTRCSQPAVGVLAKTCKEDEQIFELLRNANGSKELFIVDARPKLNAVANQVKGLGYEKGYANTRVIFLGIDNIHVMRKSFKKMKKVFLNEEKTVGKDLIAKIEPSKWLHHIKLLLNGAVVISQSLHKGFALF